MNMKQKVSVLAASVLPMLALSAYFLLTPARASADDCPPGEIYAPCYNNGGCENGAGGCYGIGQRGNFVFCRGSGYNGVCESTSCVKCN